MSFLKRFLAPLLAAVLLVVQPAHATISNSANRVVASGNGSLTVFNYSFVAVIASDISVFYTDATGVVTLLSPSLYTLTIASPAVGQIWGIGGTVTYPKVGSPIPTGSKLTIQRTVPLLQTVSLSNQGSLSPQAVETGLDLLAMQIQQVSGAQSQAIVVAPSDSAPPALPAAAFRAGKCLAFDGGGNPIAAVCGGGGSAGTPGGSNGQVQYNNSGSFAGFTVSGDCTLVASTGVITCTGTSGTPFAPSATINTANAANISSGVLAAARGGTGVSNTGTLIVPSNAQLTAAAAGIGVWTGGNLTGLTASAGQLLIGQGASTPTFNAMSGDATLASNGALTISANAVSNAKLATASALTVKSNVTGGAATPIDNSISAILDATLGSAQGDIIYRGASSWTVLVPGSSGQLLSTLGAGANPAWVTAAGTGSVTSVGPGVGISTSPNPITASGTVAYAGPTTSGRLTFASTTGVLFAPFQGDLFRIAGTIYQIPTSGIAGCTTTSAFVNGSGSSSLAASTFYYVFAFVNSGTLTCDFRTDGNGHLPDNTAGNIGTEVRVSSGSTRDSSRSLIGAVFTNGSSQFVDSLTNRTVISWYNRQLKTFQNAFTATRTTASISFVEINTEIRCNFIIWSDDAITMSAIGQSFNSGANATASALSVDTNINFTSAMSGTLPTPLSLAQTRTTTEAAIHYITLYGAVAAGTGSWAKSGVSGESFPSITGYIHG
jgi:hypothetical protein